VAEKWGLLAFSADEQTASIAGGASCSSSTAARRAAAVLPPSDNKSEPAIHQIIAAYAHTSTRALLLPLEIET